MNVAYGKAVCTLEVSFRLAVRKAQNGIANEMVV